MRPVRAPTASARSHSRSRSAVRSIVSPASRYSAASLRVMEAPARNAGLGALHDFLARGLKAFRHMRGADEFLRIVGTRERLINDRIYSGSRRSGVALRHRPNGLMA